MVQVGLKINIAKTESMNIEKVHKKKLRPLVLKLTRIMSNSQ